MGLFGSKSESTDAADSRVFFVELVEAVFTNRFIVRFMSEPAKGKAGIERAVGKNNVHIFGVQGQEDLAILIPQTDKDVDTCRKHLKSIGTEILQPAGQELGETAGVLLALS
jgi:hypothetical protein